LPKTTVIKEKRCDMNTETLTRKQNCPDKRRSQVLLERYLAEYHGGIKAPKCRQEVSWSPFRDIDDPLEVALQIT